MKYNSKYTFQCFDVETDMWVIIDCKDKAEAEKLMNEFNGPRYASVGYEVFNINIPQYKPTEYL